MVFLHLANISIRSRKIIVLCADIVCGGLASSLVVVVV